MKYGIIGAMPEEVDSLVPQMTNVNKYSFGKKDFFEGTLKGKEVVVTCSGIGKVSAGAAAAVLITKFACDAIINNGIAGGLQPKINTLDLVVGNGAIQHDVDVTVFGYKKGQVPQEELVFPMDEELQKLANDAANKCAKQYNFKAYSGLIVSGDQFINGNDARQNINENFPNAFACEMEGAAIAQVCKIYGAKCLVIRSISDKADGSADMSSEEMLPKAKDIAQQVLLEILSK